MRASPGKPTTKSLKLLEILSGSLLIRFLKPQLLIGSIYITSVISEPRLNTHLCPSHRSQITSIKSRFKWQGRLREASSVVSAGRLGPEAGPHPRRPPPLPPLGTTNESLSIGPACSRISLEGGSRGILI